VEPGYSLTFPQWEEWVAALANISPSSSSIQKQLNNNNFNLHVPFLRHFLGGRCSILRLTKAYIKIF
jgi:hypothetical protein